MSRALVNRATQDDQKAVGLYVLKEIAEKTLVSINECGKIQNYFVTRLNKNSPDVKLKALKAITFLAQHGRDDFRIFFQRENAKLKACTSFTGRPDPLRGDIPYEKVRAAASECMIAVFNSTGRSGSSSTTGRIQGMGSNKMDSMGSDGNSSGYSVSNGKSGGRSGHQKSYGGPSAGASSKNKDYGVGTFSLPSGGGKKRHDGVWKL